jgi:hypothetical protein
MKTIENPIRKMHELNRTFFLADFGSSFISLKESPLIKERKEGTSGRTQGEKKYKKPETKAIKYDTSFIGELLQEGGNFI